MFIVVFQVHVNYFILKFNQLSLMESYFLKYKKRDKFQAGKFLISGYLMAKIQAAVSYKSVSYMQVLTVFGEYLCQPTS